jgi:hypothetical protein
MARTFRWRCQSVHGWRGRKKRTSERGRNEIEVARLDETSSQSREKRKGREGQTVCGGVTDACLISAYSCDVDELIIELHFDEILALDLTHVVDDEFVVEQRTARNLRALLLAERHDRVRRQDEILCRVRIVDTAALRRELTSRQIRCVIVGLKQFVHIAECDFTEQHTLHITAAIRIAVVRRFRHHIGEVHLHETTGGREGAAEQDGSATDQRPTSAMHTRRARLCVARLTPLPNMYPVTGASVSHTPTVNNCMVSDLLCSRALTRRPALCPRVCPPNLVVRYAILAR